MISHGHAVAAACQMALPSVTVFSVEYCASIGLKQTQRGGWELLTPTSGQMGVEFMEL
eukprot:m.35496 g.35496  ORF g.35496 m.35496 type:complete len:58 (-) comp17148_c0_seq1:117-290(-)